MNKITNIHPGEILREEFLIPMEIDSSQLSQGIGVSESVINSILQEKRGITADIALRLSKYFGTSVTFWLGLQNDYDIEEEIGRLGNELEKIETIT